MSSLVDCLLFVNLNLASQVFRQLRRTTKCVGNIVFRVIYRSVEHAVL